jgi:hypothetical protein
VRLWRRLVASAMAAGSTAERTADNLTGRVHPAVISTHS